MWSMQPPYRLPGRLSARPSPARPGQAGGVKDLGSLYPPPAVPGPTPPPPARLSHKTRILDRAKWGQCTLPEKDCYSDGCCQDWGICPLPSPPPAATHSAQDKDTGLSPRRSRTATSKATMCWEWHMPAYAMAHITYAKDASVSTVSADRERERRAQPPPS